MSPNCQDCDAPNIPFFYQFILDMYEVTTSSRSKKKWAAVGLNVCKIIEIFLENFCVVTYNN